MRTRFSAALAIQVLVAASLSAQTAVTLSTSANPATFGQLLTLTATVTPSAATGKVTFYDGATVLGTSTISAGKAVISTQFLLPGSRSLKAYYAGDGSHASATSMVVSEKIKSASSNGFTTSSFPTYNSYDHVLAGDFNGDGKADLMAVGSYGIGVFLGVGDGTFKAAG